MDQITLQIPTVVSHQVVPPRCRKVQTFSTGGAFQVRIRSVSSEEAPVAFQWKGYSRSEGEGSHRRRWYRGKLYTPVLYHVSGKRPQHLGWRSLVPKTAKDHERSFEPIPTGSRIVGDDLAASKRMMQAELNTQLVIDGKLWAVCEEPRYYVLTQGLGHDHGATSLNIGEDYNPNIPGRYYFRADQFEAAEACMRQVAAARGDVQRVFTIRPAKRIQILIPQAVRLKPIRAKGCAFVNAVEAHTRQAKTPAEAALLSLVTLRQAFR